MQVSRSILIIDDEENLRHSLAMILDRAGYSVHSVASAAQALENIQCHTYDLIFLDLKIPDMDGLTLLPIIHQDHPEIPVLVLTAYGDPELVKQAMQMGAQDYIRKPVDPSLILDRVRRTIPGNNYLY